MRYSGGCHCGAVRFEVDAPEVLECYDCNCSICRLTGHWHLIVPKSRFWLLQGESFLTTYQFQTRVAQHRFCRICGIKSFYVPRSNPDGVDVNARCLVPAPAGLRLLPFDGQNWEQAVGALSELSQDDPAD